MRQNRKKRFVSWVLLIEVMILVISPSPFFEYEFRIDQYVVGKSDPVPATYLISDWVLLFMFFRLYIILRSFFNHTEFSDPYAKLHCERHGFTANTRFCFK